MKIVAFSDTHSWHRKVTIPDGDVLIFAGDAMADGYSPWELADFIKWFQDQPHKYKIFVAGNHDRLLELRNAAYWEHAISEAGIFYLKDTGVELDGVKFWGCPYQPEFCNWAFNVPRGEMHKHWDLIPKGTDVLVSHGPPVNHCDQSIRWKSEHLGDVELYDAITRESFKIVFCGHIHGGYGVDFMGLNTPMPTAVHNVAICNEAYQPVNQPQVVYFCPL